MDRRDSIKSLALAVLAGELVLEACNNPNGKNGEKASGEKSSENMAAAWAGKFNDWETSSGRQEWERERDKTLMKKKFFNKHEMATIGVLADIIIPKDDKSGSATDVGVPDFIEFIVKDMPQHQTPMRGGLRWVDLQMLRRHDKAFIDASEKQQLALVDEIAYPWKAKPEMKPGATFFSLMRNLTASGFFSSKEGIKDLGYKGNSPTVWDGVPDDVLKQYGKSYTEKQLKECVKKEDHNKMFVFDS